MYAFETLRAHQATSPPPHQLLISGTWFEPGGTSVRPTNFPIAASAFSRRGFELAAFFRSAIRFCCAPEGFACPRSSFSGRRSLRSEEHTSELQSRFELVCRLLLEKKNASVRAKTRNVPANAPFVIHCFVPLIRQPS